MRQNCPGDADGSGSLDIPCILLPGGPMEGGSYLMDEIRPDIECRSFGMLSAKNYRRRVYFVEDLSCPTCGSCSYLGTANNVFLSEALG